jgi:flagellar biosynthesis GTPase FlhF
VAFIVVFAINTGIFNGMVNNAFHPVREQLEGMIPFADPDRQHQQQNQPETVGANQNGENGANLDPAQTAARLVAQRRIQNGSWLRDQVRRIERASILFLASFAPGVAERHIQQLEERERAERRAAEEARAAAAAAAEQQQQAEQATAENQEGREALRGETEDGVAQPQEPQAPEAQPQPPLVAV